MAASRPPTLSSSSEALERAAQLAELIVDVHAQRLERARRGILAGLTRAYGACHDLRELQRARERLPGTRRDDIRGNASRETLLPQGRDHLANLRLARSREPCGNRFAARRVHAHVERAVRPETETTCRVVELRRRDAEVEQNAAHGPARNELLHARGDIGKRRTDERKPHFVGKTAVAGLDGRRIAVEREHAPFGAECPEDECRVTAAPERRIYV